jgi:hypothetical protein
MDKWRQKINKKETWLWVTACTFLHSRCLLYSRSGTPTAWNVWFDRCPDVACYGCDPDGQFFIQDTCFFISTVPSSVRFTVSCRIPCSFGSSWSPSRVGLTDCKTVVQLDGGEDFRVGQFYRQLMERAVLCENNIFVFWLFRFVVWGAGFSGGGLRRHAWSRQHSCCGGFVSGCTLDT